jgi:hypothetical protein
MSGAVSPIARAKQAWGETMPEWVARLAQECEATSQARVAAQLNRSASLVSNVLTNRYPGNLDAVEEVVRGVFMAAHINCPALGQIPSSTCQDWRRQSHKMNTHNAQRVSMFRACNRCPINEKSKLTKEGQGHDY